MAALEELFLLLDQVWRVMSGIRSHRAGTGFLAGYRRYGQDIAVEFATLRGMSEDEWRDVFGLPTDYDLPAFLSQRGVTGDLDVGDARRLRDDVLATAVRNMREVAVFFVRTDPFEGQQGRSLRDVNNAYRHGTQVVYEDTSPEDIPWRAANPEEPQGMLVAAMEVDALARLETVNVLLEGPDEEGHARFASVPRSAEMNQNVVVSMRNLSILLWRIVTAFLVTELEGGPVLSALMPFSWDELDARYRKDEGRRRGTRV
jgi:hypothetical protein